MTPDELMGDIESRVYQMADDELRGGVNGGGAQTRYSQYQLPGGANYREHLLTLPEKRLPDGRRPDPYDPAQQDLGNYHSSHWDEPNVLAHVRTNDRTMNVDAPQFKLRNKTSGNTTKAFDSEEAALAHRETLPEKLRPNLEVVKAGDTKPIKSLHIEEIQSDWHQQGRKQGYAGGTSKEGI